MDYQALPPVDLYMACDPEVAVTALLAALGDGKPRSMPNNKHDVPAATGAKFTVDHMTEALRKAVSGRDVTLTHVSLSWNGALWPLRHPLDYLGSDGGGGVGGGPGISIGAALALKGSGRLVVAVCGDGDFMMNCTAIWTAVHYRIPILFVIANNRSFFNDELHQERVARMRNRPVENRWVGQRISEPDIDIATIARGQGAEGFGPVSEIADLPAVLAQAIAAVDAGKVAVIDARVEPGYTAATTAEMTRIKSA
jgi:thiamine pyrophosphate-dependent acetolactate synthase large subunit-like protein